VVNRRADEADLAARPISLVSDVRKPGVGPVRNTLIDGDVLVGVAARTP
jgi:hypothetical protein